MEQYKGYSITFSRNSSGVMAIATNAYGDRQSSQGESNEDALYHVKIKIDSLDGWRQMYTDKE